MTGRVKSVQIAKQPNRSLLLESGTGLGPLPLPFPSMLLHMHMYVTLGSKARHIPALWSAVSHAEQCTFFSG
jgi:hypothetical protein